MEQLGCSNKSYFKQATVDLFNLYKQAGQTSELAYNQGKEDAYEEILKYLMRISGS